VTKYQTLTLTDIIWQVSPSTAETLGNVIRLFALKRIELELSWLIGEGLLPAIAGKTVPALIRYNFIRCNAHYMMEKGGGGGLGEPRPMFSQQSNAEKRNSVIEAGGEL
jgi:hypothetical protein